MTVNAAHHQDNLAKMAALEQRVSGIESGLNSVIATLNRVSDKLDTKSVTPWSQIWSAIGVMLTAAAIVGGLAFRSIEGTLIRHEVDLRQISAQTVPRAEHEGRWRQDDREMDILRRRFERVEDQVFKRPP